MSCSCSSMAVANLFGGVSTCPHGRQKTPKTRAHELQDTKRASCLCSVRRIVYLAPYHKQFKVPLILCLLGAQREARRAQPSDVHHVAASPVVYSRWHVVMWMCLSLSVWCDGFHQIFAIGHGPQLACSLARSLPLPCHLCSGLRSQS